MHQKRGEEKAKLEVSPVVWIVPVGVACIEARLTTRGEGVIRRSWVGDASGPTGFASNPRFIDREVPGEPNGRPCSTRC